jgi:hypothetical protein
MSEPRPSSPTDEAAGSAPPMTGGQAVQVSQQLDAIMRAMQQLTGLVHEANLRVDRVEGNHRQQQMEAARRELITNPRMSFSITQPSAPSATAAASPHASRTVFSPAAVPHRQGRLTMSPHMPATAPSADEKDDGMEEANGDSLSPVVLAADQHRRRLDRLLKKAEGPVQFSGDETQDKIPDVRDWVEAVDSYLDMMLEDDHTNALQYVLTRTVGAAHNALKVRRDAFNDARRKGLLPASSGDLQWDEVKFLFIEEFEGAEFRALKKLQLEALRLGSEKLKTPILLNAKFDQLARRIYPAGTDLAAMHLDCVLADEYSKIIRHSDGKMWKDMSRVGGLYTLAAWKQRTAQAWAAKEVVKTTEAAWRQESSSHAAALHGMGLGWRERDEESDTEEEEAAAAQMQVTQKKPTAGKYSGSVKKPPGFRLPDEQYRKVMAEGRCLQCYKKGHRRGEAACPEKGKQRRLPTQQELNS